MSCVDYCNAVFAKSPRYITDKLQCVLNAAAHLVTGTHTTACHTCCMQGLHWLDVPERIHNKLGVTVHRCLQNKAPEYLVDCCTPVSRHSQLTSFTVSYSTSPDCTKLPAQHFRSSGLLCCRSDGLELATGQSPWPGARQQQLQTIAENEPISLLPLSTHSAVEMLHDSALYKSIIDTDNDITFTKFYRNKTTWQRTSNFSKSWQKTAHRDKDLLTETTYQLCWPLVTVE